MLARSTSSRRRRASRSAATSPHPRGVPSAAPTGRRASIAVSPSEPDHYRNSLVPDIVRTSRNSLTPEAPETQVLKEITKSERNIRPVGLAPEFDRSPRNSLIPESQKSPRHSLVPTDYRSDISLSPRNSICVPDYNRSSRNSLVPEPNRSPRHSLTPENSVYNSKLNVSTEFNRSPRNSLVPDANRPARRSFSETTNWRTDENNRVVRHTPAPDTISKKSYREEISGTTDRSPRGSIGPEIDPERSPRGSLARANLEDFERKSPRGSLTLTFQEPPATGRRASTDNAGVRIRSSSPYRSRSTVAGYSGFNESGSRRASSSVSQVSGDEQRRLCVEHNNAETQSMNIALSLTTYGSVAYQLKDANLEANGTCDFVCKALDIVNKTVVVTIMLACLSLLPIFMLIMGVQFLRDCPREPNIPIYMIVGGSVGSIKMGLTLYSQFHTRPPNTGRDASSIVSKVASVLLTAFLLAWFALGNYWILRILWPDYESTLFEPNKWCHKTLYVFSLVHLCIVYTFLAVIVMLVIILATCQLFGCSWLGPARYK